MTCPFMLDYLNLISAWSTNCGPKLRARKDLHGRQGAEGEKGKEKKKKEQGFGETSSNRSFSVKV